MSKSVLARTRRILSEDFFKHNLIFLVGTAFVSVLNYAYNPIISRLVSVGVFGDVQASIALFMQFGVLLTSFGYVVSFLTVNEHNEHTQSMHKAKLQWYLIVSLAVVAIALGVFSTPLAQLLQLSSIWPIVLVGLVLLVNVPSTAQTYSFQALKKFWMITLGGIIFATLKIVFTVGFVSIGFEAASAMAGFLIAQIFVVIFFMWQWSRLRKRQRPNSLDSMAEFSSASYLRLFVVVCVLLGAVNIFLTADTLVAKIILSPDEAGMYGGASTIARIIYFGAAPVSGVLLVSVGLAHTALEARSYLRKAVLFTALIGFAVSLLLIVWPKPIVEIFLGQQFGPIAPLLPWLGALVTVTTINNVFVSFFIARRDFASLIPVAISLAALSFAVVVVPKDYYGIVIAFLCGALSLLFGFIALAGRRFKEAAT